MNLVEIELDDLYYRVFTMIGICPIYLQKKNLSLPSLSKEHKSLNRETNAKRNVKRMQTREVLILKNKIFEEKFEILPEDSYLYSGVFKSSLYWYRAQGFN